MHTLPRACAPGHRTADRAPQQWRPSHTPRWRSRSAAAPARTAAASPCQARRHPPRHCRGKQVRARTSVSSARIDMCSDAVSARVRACCQRRRRTRHADRAPPRPSCAPAQSRKGKRTRARCCRQMAGTSAAPGSEASLQPREMHASRARCRLKAQSATQQHRKEQGRTASRSTARMRSHSKSTTARRYVSSMSSMSS
jgi:hypothetical protein